METEILTQLGLCRNESKVYLALLDAGAASAGVITKNARLHRTNVYDALEKLVIQGLVGYIDTEGTRVYKCLHPGNLSRILEEKLGSLHQVLPSLTQAYERCAPSMSKVTVLEGYKNCIAMLQDFLSDSFIWIYGLPHVLPMGIRNALHHFQTEVIQKQISFRAIVQSKGDIALPSVRYVAGADPHATFILSDTKLLIIQWERQPLLIHITHPAVIRSYRTAFEIMYTSLDP